MMLGRKVARTVAEAHQRLDALADTGQKRLQRPQYITEDGVGSNSARAAVTDALPRYGGDILCL